MNNNDKYIWKKLYASFSGKKKTSCPDTNFLAAYIENKLSKKQTQTIELHLIQCPLCIDALIELRLLLKEKPVKPSQYVMERAKDLVSPSVTKKPAFIIKTHIWLRRPYPYVRKYVSIAAAIAVITASCFTGLKFGREVFNNQRLILSADISEISFELGDKTVSGLGSLGIFMREDNE